MVEPYDRDSCYCLLIAVIVGVNPHQARMLYQYPPEHPVCKLIMEQRGLEADPDVKTKKKERRQLMMQMRNDGYTLREIADFFECDISTVTRNLKKASCIVKEE